MMNFLTKIFRRCLYRCWWYDGTYLYYLRQYESRYVKGIVASRIFVGYRYMKGDLLHIPMICDMAKHALMKVSWESGD